MKEMIFLKGKESALVGVLLVLAVIIFIVPIALILVVRSLYKMIQIAKEQSRIPQGVNADFEKVY
jgi:hypothetical protein